MEDVDPLDEFTEIILESPGESLTMFGAVPLGEDPPTWLADRSGVTPEVLRQAIIDALAADPSDSLTELKLERNGVSIRFSPIPDTLQWEVATWA